MQRTARDLQPLTLHRRTTSNTVQFKVSRQYYADCVCVCLYIVTVVVPGLTNVNARVFVYISIHIAYIRAFCSSLENCVRAAKRGQRHVVSPRNHNNTETASSHIRITHTLISRARVPGSNTVIVRTSYVLSVCAHLRCLGAFVELLGPVMCHSKEDARVLHITHTHIHPYTFVHSKPLFARAQHHPPHHTS